MSDTAPNDPEAILQRLEDTHDDPVLFIGQVIWELVGRSIGRMALVFATVFLASFAPAALIVLGMTAASQSVMRGALLVVAVVCLVPFAGLAGFNYVAYRGLRDLVEKIGLGQRVGAQAVAFLAPSGGMRLPLSDLTDRLKAFARHERADIRKRYTGVRGLLIGLVLSGVVHATCLAVKRLAKGCLVDGEVDLALLGTAIGERADGMLIAYFKQILWDLTRVLLIAAVLVFWLLLYLVIQAIHLIG